MDRLVFGPLDVGGTLQLGQRHEGIGLIEVLALLRAPDLQREQIAIPAKAGGAEAARLVDAPAQRVIAVVGRLRGGRWRGGFLWPYRLERRPVMQARDGDAFELVLGAVMKLLHRVPADAPLGDVAMHVVGKAQVFIHGDAVEKSLDAKSYRFQSVIQIIFIFFNR